jgi:hypothetical protein
MSDTEAGLRARIIELERANALLHARLDELRRVFGRRLDCVPFVIDPAASPPLRPRGESVASWDARWDQLRREQAPGTASDALGEGYGASGAHGTVGEAR